MKRLTQKQQKRRELLNKVPYKDSTKPDNMFPWLMLIAMLFRPNPWINGIGK